MTTERTFRYVKMPSDMFRRAWYIRLRRRFPNLLERWFHVVILAQDARAAGRVLVGGSAVDAEELALSWNPMAGDEEVQDWQAMLDHLVDEEVLDQEDDGTYRLPKASEWYQPWSKLEGRDHRAEWDDRKDRRNEARRVGKNGRSGTPGKTRERPSTNPDPDPDPDPDPERKPDPESSSSTKGARGASAAADDDAPVARNGGKDPLAPVLSGLSEVAREMGIYGDLTGQDRLKVSRWALAAIREGVATAGDVLVAVKFGGVRAAEEVAAGKQVDDRWAYACGIARNELAAVVEYRQIDEWNQARGHPPARPYWADSTPAAAGR